MTGKSKPEQLRDYAARFAQVATEKFFSGRDRITGKEILTLTPVEQVNLFIIRELLLRWESESAKLKSPWFDYQSEEVQKALAHFRNTLSNHISVARQDLLPLVEKAVTDTLRVTLSPYDYFADLLEPDSDRMINLSVVRIQVRYMRINRQPMEKLVDEINKQGLEKISAKEAFALLDRLLEQSGFSPADPDEVLAHLSGVLSTSDLTKGQEPAQPAPTPTSPPVKKTESSPAAAKPEKTAAPKKPAPVQISLYDELNTESRPTLADDFRNKKIQKLREHLTINQKFMFTKTLFNGDFEMFDQAIERLDRMDNLKQVERFLDQDYPEWDRESEEYLEFRQLIERRFLPA